MKALCRINNILKIKDSSITRRLQKYIHLPDGQLNLEKNREYCIYGIVFRDDSPWYYLCLDDDISPSPYPAELFDVSDERLSLYWKLSTVDQGEGETLSSLVFDEWAKDPSFYERLIDDDPEAVELFEKYRQLMDQE